MATIWVVYNAGEDGPIYFDKAKDAKACAKELANWQRAPASYSKLEGVRITMNNFVRALNQDGWFNDGQREIEFTVKADKEQTK